MSNANLTCPNCNSAEIVIHYSGLWSGVDKDGHGIGGSFHYGICQQCGSRCAQYGGDTFVPTEQEWKNYVRAGSSPGKQVRKWQESWPFPPTDEEM